MDKPIEFRRRGRGYDKNDVNEFISRENIRFNKIEEEYNRTIRELESEVEKLTAQLSEKENDKEYIITLEMEISDLKDKIASLESSLSEKDTIIDGLKSAVDNANSKLDMANSIIEDQKNKSNPHYTSAPEPTYQNTYYDDEVIEKAQKYDAISESIDEIFAFAKEEADKIIAEAVEIRKQAIKRSPSQVKNEISGKGRSIIDELKSNLRKQLKK